MTKCCYGRCTGAEGCFREEERRRLDAVPRIELLRAHETDDTLDEYGIFVSGKCIAHYEGENQARMALRELLAVHEQSAPQKQEG